MKENNKYIKSYGHYSTFKECKNGMYLLSGIKAWGLLKNNIIVGNITSQCKDVFHCLDQILNQGNLNKFNIVRVQCFLNEINDYEDFNTNYINYMGSHKPTRSVIGGCILRCEAKIEIIVDCYVS